VFGVCGVVRALALYLLNIMKRSSPAFFEGKILLISTVHAKIH